MMNEICANCRKTKREHTNWLGEHSFEPSGRVVVPVEFIEAVRIMRYNTVCGRGYPHTLEIPREDYDIVFAMLDQIDKEGT